MQAIHIPLYRQFQVLLRFFPLRPSSTEVISVRAQQKEREKRTKEGMTTHFAQPVLEGMSGREFGGERTDAVPESVVEAVGVGGRGEGEGGARVV